MNKWVVSTAVASVVVLAGCGSPRVDSPDLNKVLDVFEVSLDSFQSELNVEDPAEREVIMKEFTQYTQEGMNNPPIDKEPVGLTLKDDGSFSGYNDKNGNGLKDLDEKQTFTVEVDTEKNRLIATDTSGNNTGTHFSGTGLLAGLIIGNLLSRQRSAGVSSKSLSSRKVSSRSAYSSARSSGFSSSSSARSKSFSGSHSSGK